MADLLPAQITCPSGSSAVPIMPYNRTFSSTGATRGYYFQAPACMSIDAVSVPDEAAAGVQNVEIYRSQVAPPAFSATITPTLVYSVYGQPVGTIRTGGVTFNAGDWVIVLGATGTTTMNNSYGPQGGFATTILGVPVTLNRALTQTNINTNPGPNPISSENAFEPSRIEICVSPVANCPPLLEATTEGTLGSTMLSSEGGQFRDLDFMRWNYRDVVPGTNAGNVAFNIFNIGLGGSPPEGTSVIPGFVQLWAGSTPSGTPIVGPVDVIGGPDTSFQLPAGLFQTGDVIRMQALMLDAAATPLPVTTVINVIEFTHTNCFAAENFDNLASGAGNYPTGWSNGGGTLEWVVDSAGTSSSGTGPTSAVSGANYMYCETSSPATTGYTWIMNTAAYPSASLSNNTLSFQLSRIGATIGTLEVRMDDGTGTFATLLATYTGPDPAQSQGGQEWTFESIALPTPLPANVSFQFNYTYGGSFTGDIAIDDFCIE